MGVGIDKLCMALSTKTSVDGLWVGASGERDKQLLQKLCESIALIKTYDPLRYKRLCRDVKRIWIALVPGANGAYKEETDSCHIDRSFAASHDAIFIASVIVHEATHARLRRFGYGETLRHRLEVACRKQEIVFIRKVPEMQAALDSLQARVPRIDDYTYESWAERYNRGLVTAARDMGIPSWAVKMMFKIRGLRECMAMLKRRKSSSRQPS